MNEADFKARLLAAMKETEDILREDPSRSGDPTLPVFRVAAEWELESERRKFESGDKMALLAAIRECANHDLVLPPWVSKGFLAAYRRVQMARVGSWDEAFGRPYPKGAHLSAARKRYKHRVEVWRDVTAESRAGRPIDDSLFAEVGTKFGLGKTLTAELYYGVLPKAKKKKADANPALPRKRKTLRKYKRS